ncbi:NAD(P)/FAD-dependent oxidoreductase [Roseateles violae]|uniref:FAD-binding oxidoreductase n=1 Tax=Roseateles violae TaxID=3058042 RepID=A0ABT8DVX0_9BURK|nr:FAD-binding oxidoreductase [Pelomonas sp. PFR6]MDN3922298.1 FAD-binding oxidoreductase [Pelomonas sp. PFR6]
MAGSVLIIGGGAIGSAVAAWLSAEPAWQVEVLERDPSYARASSALSAASIRQQFSTPLNIALSQFGLHYLRALPEAGLQEQGYLYLATEKGAADLRQLQALQTAQGAEIELMTPTELRHRWPWLATQDLALGSWGRRGEGWFDGWGLLQALRRRALRQGSVYRRAEALELRRDASGALDGVLTAEGLMQADLYVLACGAWSGALAATAGLEVPVSARRRSVYVFRSPETASGCPLLIDPSGLWLRPEGEAGQFLCGGPPLDDAPDLPLEPEADLFEERLWPALAARVPGFETLRCERAWAGYYEMCDFDHNGLVGPLAECPNLLLACGFSGHGLQHAPGIGRGLAELIAFGAYRSLDLGPLSPTRIAAGRPYRELNVI